MNHQKSQSQKVTNDTTEIVVYECGCSNKKKIKVIYDGGFGDKFTVEYCQKCYESDDKQFMLSMEVIS